MGPLSSPRKRGYYNNAQAATELAVFGAILIFLLGTIIRSAAGNGLTQNQNFNAMRMAMLSSWVDSKAANPSHNSPSLLIVEDQLSPDFNKYGDVDRNPYVTSTGGSFTYEMLYPMDVTEVSAFLPIMDVWINGQHFPFTTASFNSAAFTPSNEGIIESEPGFNCAPGVGAAPSSYQSPAQIQQACSSQPNQQQCQIAACKQNQCSRNQREWVSISPTGPNGTYYNYKLFYTREPDNSVNIGTDFYVSPPICGPAYPNCDTLSSTSTQINDPLLIDPTTCLNKALTSCTILTNGATNFDGDMEFDLLRTGNYIGSPN
jgi:hypothetical protein